MADDLADFPIVVLENDYPEASGKLGLFDLIMPVGGTGLQFVAAMPGILRPWGVEFSAPVRQRAYLKAASTLVQMGLIGGESFAFLRSALELSQADVAALYGVTEPTVVGWEDNSIPIPINVWQCFSYRVCLADGVALPNAAFGTSFRPRLIRVFPNPPMVSQQQTGDNNPCPPQPPWPGAECFPPFKPY